jgi:ketosteroid isomerase-like protein
MSTEQSKKLASEFFARLSANDIAGALDIMAEDVMGRWQARAETGGPGPVPSPKNVA